MSSCPRCGRPVSFIYTLSGACPDCRKRGSSRGAGASEENSQQKKKEQPEWFSYVFAVVVSASCLWCVLFGRSSDDPDYIGICTACQNEIRDALRSPSSADFAPCGEDTIKKTDNDDNRYFVGGVVDADNAFGASLRFKYICIVEATGDGKTEVIEAEIEKR